MNQLHGASSRSLSAFVCCIRVWRHDLSLSSPAFMDAGFWILPFLILTELGAGHRIFFLFRGGQSLWEHTPPPPPHTHMAPQLDMTLVQKCARSDSLCWQPFPYVVATNTQAIEAMIRGMDVGGWKVYTEGLFHRDR